ncbi:hypothetical protein BJX61DRAFT_48758 [Aspergillus egyptiacus]|nr:hypothetical protein BJX61DRAFT_48758 [Aspergillus egyptiacus]
MVVWRMEKSWPEPGINRVKKTADKENSPNSKLSKSLPTPSPPRVRDLEGFLDHDGYDGLHPGSPALNHHLGPSVRMPALSSAPVISRECAGDRDGAVLVSYSFRPQCSKAQVPRHRVSPCHQRVSTFFLSYGATSQRPTVLLFPAERLLALTSLTTECSIALSCASENGNRYILPTPEHIDSQVPKEPFSSVVRSIWYSWTECSRTHGWPPVYNQGTSRTVLAGTKDLILSTPYSSLEPWSLHRQ